MLRTIILPTNTLMQSLNFSIGSTAFNLNLLSYQVLPGFQLSESFTSGDGVSKLGNRMIRAASLPNEQGKSFLFPTGISAPRTHITVRDRQKLFAKHNLADPDLLWSLVNQDDQQILSYLYDTYGVSFMDAPRRHVFDGIQTVYVVSIMRNADASWKLVLRSQTSVCFFDQPTLQLED